MLLNYTGYTFIFKAPASQITVDEIRRELENINCKSEGTWEVNIVKFSNMAEQISLKDITNVYTVHDTLLGSKVAILNKEDAKGSHAYKGDIDVLLRTLGLKECERMVIKGTNHRVGDVLYSVGNVSKIGSLSKEVTLRIELRSLVSFGSFDRKTYDNLTEDLLNVLGNTIKQAFFTKDYEANLSIFMPRDSAQLTTKNSSSQKLPTPELFDHRNIANFYCYLYMNAPVGVI